MSMARKCDRCDALHAYEKGLVSFEYAVATGSKKYHEETNYGPDDGGDRFELCKTCSAEFLSFIGCHEPKEPKR
jgi:hypothetical protein